MFVRLVIAKNLAQVSSSRLWRKTSDSPGDYFFSPFGIHIGIIYIVFYWRYFWQAFLGLLAQPLTAYALQNKCH